MTHSELVARAAKWLRGSARCQVVLTERLAMSHVNEHGAEMPDAIGWAYHDSFCVECKTSMSDLMADRRKRFRACGGSGDRRYYMCEKGVLDPSRIPYGWGLLVVCGKIVRLAKRPDRRGACAIGLRRERYLLTAEIIALRSMCEHYKAKIEGAAP